MEEWVTRSRGRLKRAQLQINIVFLSLSSQENYLMAVARYPFRDIHTLQFGMAYENENEIFIIYPEVTLSLADAASLVLSAILIDGDLDVTFLSEKKDRIFVKVEYSFLSFT